MENNNISQLEYSLINSTLLEQAILGLNEVTQVTWKREAIKRMLAAKASEYNNFLPSRFYHISSDEIKCVGLVVFTATFMLNKEHNGFIPCHEDIASRIKFPNFYGDKSKYPYTFMDGRSNISEEHTEKDLLIRPDGLFCNLFNMNNEDCFDETSLVKYPRKVENFEYEAMSGKKLDSEFNYIVYPHGYNKSTLKACEEKVEELQELRLATANSLAATNPGAANNQFCQAVVIGFVSGIDILSADYWKAMELIKKGVKVDRLPQRGIALRMPAWTIISRQFVTDHNSHLQTLMGMKDGYGRPAAINRNHIARALKLPTSRPHTDLGRIYKNLTIEEMDFKEVVHKEVATHLDDVVETEEIKPEQFITSNRKTIIRTKSNKSPDLLGLEMHKIVEPENVSEPSSSSSTGTKKTITRTRPGISGLGNPL
jgi:hypothetical protein